MILIVYDPATGKPEQINHGSFDDKVVAAYRAMGKGVLLHDLAIENCYVKDDGLRMRPAMTVAVGAKEIKADGNSAAVLSGIPPGATVSLSDGRSPPAMYKCDDGVCEITASDQAVYQIRIEAWPHLPFVCEVIAR